jgi:hypothetical protein
MEFVKVSSSFPLASTIKWEIDYIMDEVYLAIKWHEIQVWTSVGGGY